MKWNNDTDACKGTACLAVAFLWALIAGLFATPAAAQSVSERELQILTRAASFIRPELPSTASVAIAFEDGNAASRMDAEAIAAAFGTERRSGALVLRPELVTTDVLAQTKFSIVIAAVHANSPKVLAATRTARALCVTSELAAVREGLCAMTIQSGPRVEILLNHEAAATAGVSFAVAFRMMIREF